MNRALAETVETEPTPRREDLVRAAIWRLDGGGTPDAELVTEAARMAFFAATTSWPFGSRLPRASRAQGSRPR